MRVCGVLFSAFLFAPGGARLHSLLSPGAALMAKLCRSCLVLAIQSLASTLPLLSSCMFLSPIAMGLLLNIYGVVLFCECLSFVLLKHAYYVTKSAIVNNLIGFGVKFPTTMFHQVIACACHE